jgi:hypothetical protein
MILSRQCACGQQVEFEAEDLAQLTCPFWGRSLHEQFAAPKAEPPRFNSGDVEVFKVNHPKTQSAYAWSDADGNFTAVLGLPPATDPRNAVKVSIVAVAKKGAHGR